MFKEQRISKRARNILMEWFHNNSVNPYASPETKMILSKKNKAFNRPSFEVAT